MMDDVTLKHSADGTPYVRLYLGINKVNGRQERAYREFPGMTDDEAQAAAEKWAEMVTREREGGLTDRLGDRLNRYLEYLQADGRSYNTVDAYKTYVGYCRPIAALLVQEVTPVMLNDLYELLLTKGAHGEPLSHTTVHNFRMFLQGAFRHFVTIGLISYNPVGDSMRIHVVRPEAEAFDEDTLRAVSAWIDRSIAATSDNNYGVLRRNAAFAMYLALYTGARAGEICALRRRDLRLAAKTMGINGTVVDTKRGPVRQGTTKGKHYRNIAILDRNIDTIREHLRWQLGYLKSVSPSTPVVTRDGGYMSPASVSQQFGRMKRELGLDPSFHLHTFRHTHATWLLQNGYDMRTVQERLGHARVDTTLQLYGHVLPGRDALAAEGFGQIMDEVTG